jgi:hypothetical protein
LLSHEATGVISDVGGLTRLWRETLALYSLAAGRKSQTEAQQLPVKGKSRAAEACSVSGFCAMLQRLLPAHFQASLVKVASLALVSASRPLQDF